MRKNQYFLIYFVCLVYLSFSLILGYYSYPQEDALILFRYVNNLAETGILSFNKYGLPTEGATDFLWTIILASFVKIGINPLITSIIFSTISIFYIFRIVIRKIAPNQNIFFYFIFVIVFINIGQITGAALYGFSTIIFCATALCVYVYAIEGKYAKWSLFSIIFCLFRPEAVLFFLPTIYISYKANKKRNQLNSFYKSFIFISLTGIFYFICRYLYFNEILPLPLVVKGIGGETSIIRFLATTSQLLSTLFISFSIIVILYIYKFRKSFLNTNQDLISFFLITSSLFIYLFSLSTGYSSQNVFLRYFAPIYFSVYLFTLYAMAKFKSNKIYLFFFYILLIFGSVDNSNLLNRITKIENRNVSNPTYNIFTELSDKSFKNHPLVLAATSLSGLDSKTKIMLTEAGALPYITKFHVYDMAGLNNSMFAKRPVNCEDITNINPEIVEIDLGPASHIISFMNFEANDKFPSCGIFKKDLLYNTSDLINMKELFIVKKYSNVRTPNHLNSTVSLAASNVLYCMSKKNDYTHVFTNKLSDQLYFLKENDLVKKTLEESCTINTVGYLQN